MDDFNKAFLVLCVVAGLLVLGFFISGGMALAALWALNKLGIIHAGLTLGNCCAIWVLLFVALFIFSKHESKIEMDKNGKKK